MTVNDKLARANICEKQTVWCNTLIARYRDTQAIVFIAQILSWFNIPSTSALPLPMNFALQFLTLFLFNYPNNSIKRTDHRFRRRIPFLVIFLN